MLTYAAPGTDRAIPPFHAAPSQPSNYSPIPQPLLANVHDNPLAIGLYALVGRLYYVAHEPIPLSVPDVLRYDPGLSRGAVLRALKRLVDGGWLLASMRRGHKTRYVPTWGRVKETARPWQIGQPRMGRPGHIQRLPLDRALLDVCMGRLIPHPVEAAPIIRYITMPALSLADVGSYALTLAGLPRETSALRWLNLVHDGQARPLPDDARLLAIISQRSLIPDESGKLHRMELTTSGMRKLGMAPAPAQSDEEGHAQLLFFVPPGMIGSLIRPMIGSMIGSTGEVPAESSAAVSPETRSAGRPSEITWESRDYRDSGIPPPPPSTSGVGGGGEAPIEQRENSGNTPTESKGGKSKLLAVPDTEATRLLKTINVLPEQLIELAELPIAIVEAAIADGKARDGIRDLAGWVVKLLRTSRDYGWKIHPPHPRADSPEALNAAFARYAAQQELERRAGCDGEQPEVVCGPAPDEPKDEQVRVWNDVQAALRLQTTRQDFDTWLHPARLHRVQDGVAVIAVPNARIKEGIERRFLAPLRDLLTMYIGESIGVRIIILPSRPARSA